MKRVLASVAMLVLAGTAGAQSSASSSSGVALTVGGGAAFPNGDLSDAANTGWNLMGGVGFSLPSIPFGFRAEAMYNRFSGKDGIGGDFSTLTGGLNAVIQVPVMEGTGIQPFVTGGIGYGRSQFSEESDGETFSTSDNSFMWNAGAGIKVPLSGFDLGVEARYMSLTKSGGSINVIPVFVTLTFRP